MAKRGRPPAFDNEYMRFLKQTHPLVETRRGLVNLAYSYEAFKALDGMDGIDFIIDLERKKVKQCILVELGRLQDPQLMRQFAQVICDAEEGGNNRTAHEWAEVIRRYRLKRLKEPGSEKKGE